MRKRLNLKGQRFGKLVAIESFIKMGKQQKTYWKCICDCGNETEVSMSNLKFGHTISCGCARWKGGIQRGLVGEKFGRLRVIELAESKKGSGQYRHYYSCQCDCGNLVKVESSKLKNGHTRSCGCLRSELIRERSFKHGYSGKLDDTGTYSIWSEMKARCYRKDNDNYSRYGGRGIKVCDRWKNSFPNFLKDMGKKPEGMSLERIDNDGDYTPENCKWATAMEQSRNTRHNVWYEYANEKKCQKDWIKELGHSRDWLVDRLKKGIPFYEIVNEAREQIVAQKLKQVRELRELKF